MGIIKAVLKHENHKEVALVTSIGAIPFIDEGDQNTQDLIDGFENGSHRLSLPWDVLDVQEKSEFYDDSTNFWLGR